MGSCQHGKESWGLTQDRVCLDQLKNNYIFREHSAQDQVLGCNARSFGWSIIAGISGDCIIWDPALGLRKRSPTRVPRETVEYISKNCEILHKDSKIPQNIAGIFV
jgi:hypothetical protein